MEVKWIKITTDIFDDEKIKLIDSMPERDTILVIWLKLLTLAGKSNRSGYLLFSDNIPYDEEMLSTLFNRPVNSIRFAVGIFKKFEMIVVEHFSDDSEKEILYISNWEKHQNIEGMEKIREQTKLRVEKYRHKQKLLDNKKTCNVTSNVTVTQGNATDKDIDIDKDIIPPLPPKNFENEKYEIKGEGDLISNQTLKALSEKYSVKEVETAYSFLKHLIKQGKQIKDPLAFLFTLLKNKTYEDITEIEAQRQQKENKERENKLQQHKQQEIDDYLDKKTEEVFEIMSKEEVSEKINEIKKTLKCDEKLKDGLALLTLKANIRKDLDFQRVNTS